MVADPAVLAKRLELLRRYLVSLDRYRSTLERSAFLASADLQYQVLFTPTMAIQSCIDIAAHVSAAEGARRPGSYGDAFTALADSALLDRPLAERVAAATAKA
ncbi:MAG: DUF86 domain-containing protein [Deltaproteobacteria bacterium]|nr:DUF86 domain-containing protein [Deltaproteobacteria bacterium]